MRNTRSERGNWYHRDLEVYLRQTEDEPDQAHRALREKLALVLREEVTPRQREILWLYYGEDLNTREIGDRLGLERSTVSRTLKRGEDRVRRCLRYSRDDLPDQGGRRRKSALTKRVSS